MPFHPERAPLFTPCASTHHAMHLSPSFLLHSPPLLHPPHSLPRTAPPQGEPACVAKAVYIITAAVDRYKELCEGKYNGGWLELSAS